jgi:hypothetical protein
MSVQTGEFDGPGGSKVGVAKEQAADLTSKVQEQGSIAVETLQGGGQ